MSRRAGEVVVVATGTANLASVEAALRRAGSEPRLARDAADVARAGRLVLPGVGTLGAAMGRIRASGLETALAERIRAGRPTLAICLGLQLLAGGSDESPGIDGLGVLPVRVVGLPDAARVPHLGWSRVARAAGWLVPGWAYFAHAYAVREAPGDGWQAAWCDDAGSFVAALCRGGVVACQFHPELSGAWGAALIERWLDAPDGAGAR